MILTIRVNPYFNVYTTLFKHKHSQTVVVDSTQACIEENTTYDDKQENGLRIPSIEQRA